MPKESPLRMHPRWEFKFCVVTNVVDGDTLDIAVDLGFSIAHMVRFRLANINAPDGTLLVEAPAKDFVIDYCLNKDVRILTTKLDKYGRFLAEVFLLGDDISLNKRLLDAGLAVPYMKDHDR